MVLAATAIVLGLGTLALLNTLVDASGAFPRIGLKAFQPYRFADSRTGRGELIARGGWEVFLLGSSRILHAIDPEHPGFGGRRVVNGGLKGTNLYELDLELAYALETNELEEVLLFLDFHAFNPSHRTAADFEVSRLNPEIHPIDYTLEKLLGARALRESIKVLRLWTIGERQNPRTNRRRMENFERLLNDFVTNPTLLAGYRDSEPRMQLLAEMLRQLRARGIQCRIVIPPVHASMLETIRLLGLWDMFEDWKRALVATVHTIEPGVSVWDFTGYDRVATEPLPGPPDSTQGMQGFRDPSHMRRSIGDRVLSRVLDEPGASPTFGVRLRPQDLEEQLARIRADRERYARENAVDLVWLESIPAVSAVRRASARAGGTGLPSVSAEPPAPSR